uniref:G domain-containing protein n=1 Tax=Panagrellus redivivus TaxID=6233 RepID=A0A7E5A200_PANRE
MRLSFQFEKTGNLYSHKSFNVYYRTLAIEDFDKVDKLADFLFLDLNSLLAVLQEKWRDLLPILNFIFENKGKTMCNVIIESYKENAQVFGWHCVLAYDGNDVTKIENYIDKSKKKVRNNLPFNDTSCNALAGFGQKKFKTTLHSLFGVSNNQMPFQSSLIWIAQCDVKRISLKKRQERRVRSKLVLILTALRLMLNLRTRLNETSDIQETLTKQKDNFLKLSMELIQDIFKSIGDSPDEILAGKKSILIQHTQFVKNLIGYFDEFEQAGKDFNDDTLFMFEEWNNILVEICQKIDTLDYRFYDGLWCIVDDKAIRHPANRICASKTNYKRLKDALKIDENNKHKIIIWPSTNEADDILVYLSIDKRYSVNFTELKMLENSVEGGPKLSHYYIAACSCDPDKQCAWICTRCSVFVQVLQNARIACECGTRIPPAWMECIENCGENGRDPALNANLSHQNSENLEVDALNVDGFPETSILAVPPKETTVEINLEFNKTRIPHSASHFAAVTDSDSGLDNGTSVTDTDSMTSKLTSHFDEVESTDITLFDNTVFKVSMNFMVSTENKETTTEVGTSLTTFKQNFNNDDIKMDRNQFNGDKITPIKMFETIYHVNPTSKSMNNESAGSESPETVDCVEEPDRFTIPKLSNNVMPNIPTYTVVVAGATGAGKSTLLNNIFCMQQNVTFEKALENKDQTLLSPVRIEECIDNKLQVIEHGKYENEKFSVGKSTTQRPKDYIVDYGNFKVRFVDTPGTNDTRGDEQDRTNVKYIQDHLAGLDEVHGILFVIKTDDSKLS